MRRITTFCLLTCILCLSASARTQAPAKGKGQYAKQLESEKIAFITTVVDITPEESGPFWALYNKLEKEQKELVKAEGEAFKALNIALRAKAEDGTSSVSDAEIDKLLKAYLNAKKANKDIHAAHEGDYCKLVGIRKTAEFFSAQERFRIHQIKKLSHPGTNPAGQFGHHGPRQGNKQGQTNQPAPQSN